MGGFSSFKRKILINSINYWIKGIFKNIWETKRSQF